MDRSAKVTQLLSALSLEEKVALLAGKSVWVTESVPRLQIPSIKVTDGPNGARGDGVSGRTAACFPVGVALASSWNTELLHEVGAAIAEEAITKNAQVVLGPTINLQRSPLGGRNFECYGEDPFLTAHLGVAFVRGVQSRGVGACPKHFVCNDSEFQRHSISSEVDERTLREVYLTPFERVALDAAPWTLMSAYNRINGVFASSHSQLLRDILKHEWQFDGVVISDWGAALETVENINGGLDLEMPGPARTRGARLLQAVNDGAVATAHIDDAVARLLHLIERSGRFEHPDPVPESAADRPEHRQLARQAAAEGMVLIRNNGVLPLNPHPTKRIAVIGANAEKPQIQGGGSSGVKPHYTSTPLEAMRTNWNCEIDYASGVSIERYVPMPPRGVLSWQGEPGMRVQIFDKSSMQAVVDRVIEPEFSLMGGIPMNLIAGRKASGVFRATLETDVQIADTGDYEFGLLSAGLSRMFVDNEELIDNWTQQMPGDAFFGFASTERRNTAQLISSRTHRLRIEFESIEALITGVRFGIAPVAGDDPMQAALQAAEKADIAIVIAGSNADWETEGHDRTTLALPGNQDAMIQAIAAVNANTVVVLNTGAACDMPWMNDVAAIVYAWQPGQEFGNALTDILSGAQNPSGKLPATLPRRLEDTPAFTSYPGENGTVFYSERTFCGHRWFDARDVEPLVPFGHGLSYTTFEYSNLQVANHNNSVDIRLDLTNSGDRAGAEVVQVYLHAPGRVVQRAPKELRAFQKCYLAPGECRTLSFELTERDLAYWDVTRQGWSIERGAYQILIGASSRDIRLQSDEFHLD